MVTTIKQQELGSFQLGRLYHALGMRQEAGTKLAERLADHAIVSLLQACDEAGPQEGEYARLMIAAHMPSKS